jgi:hypothetical protein
LARPQVRGTLSASGPRRPAVVAPLARTLGLTKKLLVHIVLKSLTAGIQLALLAPPVAAVVNTITFAVTPSARDGFTRPGSGGYLGVLLGLTIGAYILGAIPAFVSGLALPLLRKTLSPALVAGAVGILAACVYFLTFGSHLLPGPNLAATLWFSAVPAFLGAALPAYAISRLQREA